MIEIREYKKPDEKEWLDVHAVVMVDSYAWWTAIHKKPKYTNDTIDLVALLGSKIIGFISLEINSRVVQIKDMGFVWEFGVTREYRGKNIGRRLIDKVHSMMSERYGIKKSIWFSQDPNSQKYYEHIGMKEIERHWQFSIYPNPEIKQILKETGFKCWSMRGECSMEEFDGIKDKFNLVEDDDPVNPRICIGYEFNQ